MSVQARFAHVNLIAEDFERLVAFYRDVFGCEPMTTDQRLTGEWVGAITGVPGAAIRVVHLRLPGGGEGGPSLELIRYDEAETRPQMAANRPGFGHIAFAVDDVAAARDAVVAAGGAVVGELRTVDVPGRGTLTEIYVTDPEGNIIELQSWSR